jgi:hypothetical protein
MGGVEFPTWRYTVIAWKKTPGSKRYTATHRGIYLEIVRQNTAAGASRWLATAGREYPKRIAARSNYLSDAKSQVEAFVASL